MRQLDYPWSSACIFDRISIVHSHRAILKKVGLAANRIRNARSCPPNRTVSATGFISLRSGCGVLPCQVHGRSMKGTAAGSRKLAWLATISKRQATPGLSAWGMLRPGECRDAVYTCSIRQKGRVHASAGMVPGLPNTMRRVWEHTPGSRGGATQTTVSVGCQPQNDTTTLSDRLRKRTSLHRL